MKQVLQNLRSGETSVTEVPAPAPRPDAVLIRSRRSLISAGTEKMLVEFGKGSLLAKAKAQPDKVSQVLDKIRTDGLLPTLETVFNRLNEPLPLGYCNAGEVLQVGPGVNEFQPGDRVVSNGPHAEIVCVPRNLCAKIPDGVSFEDASFTVLSSIGLQGIRLLQPTLGERFVVYGMGLIGLVATQLLRASGCEVMGVDLSADRLAIGQRHGAVGCDVGQGGDPIAAVEAWTEGRGVDGVLITAAAKTDEIIHAAAQMCRKRGRIVLVGVVGLNLRRSDFYEKELTFQVSCSYGPGRYDEAYEQAGHDYPLPYVRWTEQRNFQAILQSISSGRLKVDDLITHRFPITDAPAAYELIRQDPVCLGVVLEYPGDVDTSRRLRVNSGVPASGDGRAVIGVIGAGNFSKMTLMPAVAKCDARTAYICDLDGAAAAHLARKFHVEQAVTDYRDVLNDPNVTAVLTAVGHNLHARFVQETLQAGKHAFVEKPLAMSSAELADLVACAQEHPGQMVMVGFNRRFSPHLQKAGRLLAGRSEPLAMTFTANAGIIPPTVWVHDPLRGGGRIIGEACHFIDLMVFLTGSHVRSVAAHMFQRGTAVKEDKMSISLGFEDGSVGAVNYFGNGAKNYPKERLEVFSEGRVLLLDNFRRLSGYGFRGFRKFKTWRQDKGHQAELAAFIERVSNGGAPLIPMDQMVNVTLASFAAMTAATESRTVLLDEEYGEVIDPVRR